jgi:hypothetical protein
MNRVRPAGKAVILRVVKLLSVAGRDTLSSVSMKDHSCKRMSAWGAFVESLIGLGLVRAAGRSLECIRLVCGTIGYVDTDSVFNTVCRV